MNPLITFVAKTAIVAAAVTVSAMILMDNLISSAGDFVDDRVRQIASSLKETGLTKFNGKMGGRVFWGNLARALDAAADPKNDLPPERQRQLLLDVRVLADRARPFILEVEKAFQPQQPKTQ